jgi:hypothetical protein
VNHSRSIVGLIVPVVRPDGRFGAPRPAPMCE